MTAPNPTSRNLPTSQPSLTYLPEGLPAPAAYPDGLGAEFWEATKRHELLVQRCNACRGWQWGPEYVCHQCHSFDLGYEPVSGRGRIFSWERPWYAVHPALREATPYLVVLVELPDADNVRMVGNLLGDPLQTVPIGAEVEAVFEEHGQGDDAYTLVQWRLIE
jgi:uncharacterized OB-fold protein